VKALATASKADKRQNQKEELTMDQPMLGLSI
jgi:hypothetical protein